MVPRVHNGWGGMEVRAGSKETEQEVGEAPNLTVLLL